MAFKTVTKRTEPGSYSLSYGKGKGKITGSAWLDVSENRWVSAFDEEVGEDSIFKCETKRGVVEQWGARAASLYHGGQEAPSGGDSAEEGPAQDDSRTPVSQTVPPPVPPKGPQLPEPEASDPFDPAHRYPSDHPNPALRQKLTPLGTLIEIYDWYKRHRQRINEIGAKLAEKAAPSYNPFDAMIHTVENTLHAQGVNLNDTRRHHAEAEADPGTAGTPETATPEQGEGQAPEPGPAGPAGPARTTDDGGDGDDIPPPPPPIGSGRAR